MKLKYTTEEFKKIAEEANPLIEVIGEYRGSSIPTKIRYKECGHEHAYTLAAIKRNNPCPVCSGEVIVKGVNDLWITEPDVAKYLEDKEDCECGVYTKSKHWFRCPICGYRKLTRPMNIKYNGMCCPCSSDGFSSGEKAMMYILNINKINYQSQMKFKWGNNKKYDFYIEEKSLIIEVQGGQHKSGVNMFNERDEVENDKIKLKYAKDNGIQNYVYIDYSITTPLYLIEQVRNSILVDLLSLDLDLINLKDCALYASSSFKRKAWDLWRDGLNSREIATELHLGTRTVVSYLHDGDSYGIITYDSVLARKKGSYTKVICINTGEIFDGITIAEEKYNIKNISGNCNGKINSAGKDPNTGEPLVWMYYDEYLEKGQYEYNTNLEKKVVCLNNNYVFFSMTIAANWCGLKSQASITQFLKRKGKHEYAGRHPETGEKLTWMYYDDYIKEFDESTLIKYQSA